MKHYPIIFFFLLLLFSCTTAKRNTFSLEKAIVDKTLDSWHKAAAAAQFENYFTFMTTDGVFVGTDSSENWQNKAFKTFSKPYFDKGKAWHFTSIQRNIYFNKNQDIAWFDELLDTPMEICRGSGVLKKENSQWKIAHYVLSITVPNENTNQVVKIKSQFDADFKKKLSRLKE